MINYYIFEKELCQNWNIGEFPPENVENSNQTDAENFEDHFKRSRIISQHMEFYNIFNKKKLSVHLYKYYNRHLIITDTKK